MSDSGDCFAATAARPDGQGPRWQADSDFRFAPPICLLGSNPRSLIDPRRTRTGRFAPDSPRLGFRIPRAFLISGSRPSFRTRCPSTRQMALVYTLDQLGKPCFNRLAFRPDPHHNHPVHSVQVRNFARYAYAHQF